MIIVQIVNWFRNVIENELNYIFETYISMQVFNSKIKIEAIMRFLSSRMYEYNRILFTSDRFNFKQQSNLIDCKKSQSDSVNTVVSA